jgi:peptidoglycan/LPS O-acetylase OafA/YrhL
VIGYDYLEQIYYPTYCRLDGLSFGVLLALAKLYRPELWRRHADPRLALAAGVLCVIAALGLFAYRGVLATVKAHLLVLSLPAAMVGYPLLALGFTLILAAFLDGEALLRRWRLPGATAVAAISYSLYLCHKSVMHLNELWFGDSLSGWPGLVAHYGSSMAVGALLWAAVERPFLRLRGRVLARAPTGPGI